MAARTAETAGHLPVQLLTDWVVPRVDLADLQALRATSRHLRLAVDGLPVETWLTTARQTLPDSHPLASASSVAQLRGDTNALARMHACLRTGSLSASRVLELECWNGKYATVSPEGDMLCMALEGSMVLFKIHNNQEPELEQAACIAPPEPEEADYEASFQSACWAPDSSALLLQYQKTGEFFAGGAQVLYLVERDAWQRLTAITHKWLGTLWDLGYVGWTPDSKLIVAGWQTYDSLHYEVFDKHTGKQVAQFVDEEGELVGNQQPSLAFGKGDRVAVARPADFAVFSLTSGELLGVRPLPGDEHAFASQARAAQNNDKHNPRHGMVSTSLNGARLAFCAAQPLAVQLWDVLTLDLLACVPLPGGPGALSRLNELHHISLGSYRMFLLSRVHRSGSFDLHVAKLQTGRSGCRQIGSTCRQQIGSTARLQTGGTGCQQVLLVPHQAAHAPAISPDGAFVCAFATSDAAIEVYDVRSGRLVCTLATGFKDLADQAIDEVPQSVAIWWCGTSCLWVVASSLRGPETPSHAVMVQQLVRLQF